jgi:hypothetical protein
MMRWSVAATCALLGLPLASRAQAPNPIPIDSARRVFAEAHAMCTADAGKLWGVSLCGPLMFADPSSRWIVANESDTKGALSAKDGAFVGVLPANQNISNTAFDWSGVHWTQVVWPIGDDERIRGTIVMHELYHRIQNRLGLPTMKGGDNAHLDELNGRYYLELEWRALARALEARSDADRAEAAKDALRFRAERYRIYPKAAASERALEQNEGLAEYTGVRLGNPTAELRTKMAVYDLRVHARDATFVRSFAYATGPAYGLLLDRYAPAWRTQLKSGDGFDVMLARALRVREAPSDSLLVANLAQSYEGASLHAAEADRDAKRREQFALNKSKFIDGPVLTLPFRKMKVQFDPTTLQPFGDAGTVYPAIRITDEWGVIEGKSGALMKPDWSALVVPAPTKTTGNNVTGDGWTLTLKPGWRVVPDARSGDFTLAAPN